jgi:ABC-type glycerol-3-phosphate transport system permease component
VDAAKQPHRHGELRQFVCFSSAAWLHSSFARMKFRFKGLVFNLFTLGLMFPINNAFCAHYHHITPSRKTNSLIGVALVQTAFQLSITIIISARILHGRSL